MPRPCRFPLPAASRVRSLADLLALETDELEQLDIAEANLLCAADLPGAEGLDVDALRARLDEWARRVARETDRHLYRFRQQPEEFDGSEAYFRMLVLATVVQQDFHVRYSPRQIREIDFRDSRDLFLHGLLGGGHAGTCASMPVLYVAVGRRLGYPLKLVLTHGHVFARWEEPDGGERLNIEAASRGLLSYDDEYYKTWPTKLTDEQVRKGRYLQSLTPREELAVFLASRGHCLLDNSRACEARQAYEHAHRLVPEDLGYRYWLAVAWDRERRQRRGAAGGPGERRPAGETFVWAGGVLRRNYHPTLGRWIERDPEGYTDGPSLYEYVASQPTGCLDPAGTARISVLRQDGPSSLDGTRYFVLDGQAYRARELEGVSAFTQWYYGTSHDVSPSVYYEALGKFRAYERQGGYRLWVPADKPDGELTNLLSKKRLADRLSAGMPELMKGELEVFVHLVGPVAGVDAERMKEYARKPPREFWFAVLKDAAIDATIDTVTLHMGRVAQAAIKKLRYWRYFRALCRAADAGDDVARRMLARDDLARKLIRQGGSLRAQAGALRRTPLPDVPRIGPRRPMNFRYAGKALPASQLPPHLASKYPKGVRFNAKGFPDFSPYAKKTVRVPGLTGHYALDAQKANMAAGIAETPLEYMWHHVEDGVTMQLVPVDLHGAVSHTGGVAVMKYRP